MTLPANSSARSRPRSEGELGIEGLGQHWSLGDDDRELVLRAKGDLHRLRAAIDLCSLRATGAFVSDWSAVPPAIVNHLARQLALPAQSGIPEPTRRGTTASQVAVHDAAAVRRGESMTQLVKDLSHGA